MSYGAAAALAIDGTGANALAGNRLSSIPVAPQVGTVDLGIPLVGDRYKPVALLSKNRRGHSALATLAKCEFYHIK